MYTISQNRRELLRDNIVAGAKKYFSKLAGKEFLIICKDGKDYTVRFFTKDFIHLTGVLSDLSDERFFRSSKDSLLSAGNIKELQKYNWDTLREKNKRIKIIDEIIYGSNEYSLFMINLHTHTGNFPVAIRNSKINTCIGFKDAVNRARTLGKYSNSADADMQKEIIAVFEKAAESLNYKTVVYLKDEDMSAKLNIIKVVNDELKKLLIPILKIDLFFMFVDIYKSNHVLIYSYLNAYYLKLNRHDL